LLLRCALLLPDATEAWCASRSLYLGGISDRLLKGTARMLFVLDGDLGEISA
jgi:hypothetical protein